MNGRQGERVVRHEERGVTLMELLTVVMIVAILASIAIPSYRQYTLRANRTDAKTSLLSYAGSLERCYTRYNSYAFNSDVSLGCPVSFPQASQGGMYQITAATRTDTKFKLVATAQGAQAKDTGCATLTLDSTNDKGSTGTKTKQECWGK
jgi:type IV pilus assembly protein PilE